MPFRILIVDDEVDELAGWETAVRKAGYTVRTASSAAEALALCDESVFDLVILDYVMPKMKGLELLARIRKKHQLIRSIVVSGKLNLPEQEVKDAIRGDVETDRYFHKPVSNEQLLGAIGEILKENAAGNSWDEIARKYIQGEGNVSRAKGAQDKLRQHIKKRG